MNAPRDWIAADALKVLVVDAVDDSLALMSEVVSRMGYRALTARDGTSAVECFTAHAPDLILIDLAIPGTDSFKTTARIRELQGARWVPVVYLSARDLEGGVIEAIEAGGDDYLSKPIAVDLLRAKLKAAGRMLQLQRENAQQRLFLERYFQQSEEEQQIAGPLMQRLVQVDALREQAVQYRITPASGYSGDVIAAARTPGGVLHVLLGDGTGHGLAASLGVMPVAQPFYAMTQKGFGLISIAKEINRKIRDWLPVGRFVATTLIAVDPWERTVSVWNGGNPPAVMLDAAGIELHRFASRHLPLGVLADSDMDMSFEQVTLRADARIITCSDGVVEAESPAGTQFGIERLIDVVAGTAGEATMAAINDALSQHLAGERAHDDLSIALIDCGAIIRNEIERNDASGQKGAVGLSNWTFAIELSPAELRASDVVPMFMATLQSLSVSQAHRSNLFLILSELYNNALDHGLLLLDSRLKSGADGMERYLAMRAKRLANLTEGSITLEMRAINARGDQLRIRVQDSGQGFDWRAHRGELDVAASFGRGVSLVRRLCKSVEYIGTGNEVVAYYDFGTSAAPAGADRK